MDFTLIYLDTNVYSRPFDDQTKTGIAGDSIEEIAQYWGDSSIDDIYNRVTAWMWQTKKDKLSNSS